MRALRRALLPTFLLSLVSSALLVNSASAQGWYLMAPPMEKRQTWLEWLKREEGRWATAEKRPLDEWEMRQAFDTAEDCKTTQMVLMRVESTYRTQKIEDIQKEPWKLPGPENAAFNAKMARFNLYTIEASRLIDYSQCISAADPRLKR